MGEGGGGGVRGGIEDGEVRDACTCSCAFDEFATDEEKSQLSIYVQKWNGWGEGVEISADTGYGTNRRAGYPPSSEEFSGPNLNPRVIL